MALCEAEETSLSARYRQLRDMLERICRLYMKDESLQMTDLAARISFLSSCVSLDSAEQNKLHTFRLLHPMPYSTMNWLQPKNSSFVIKNVELPVLKLTTQDIPSKLYNLLPSYSRFLKQTSIRKQFSRMRGGFQYADDTFLYVMPVDEVSDECLRVRYNEPQVNEEFVETCKLLWMADWICWMYVLVKMAYCFLLLLFWNPIIW